MFSVLKWISFLPIAVLGVVAAWIVSPICPLAVDPLTWRLPWWLAWASTPHTDLRGDRAHRMRFGDRNSYVQLWWWVMRNPAVVFQRNVLGVTIRPEDEFSYRGDIDARDHGGGWWISTLTRNNRAVAFQVFCYQPYGSSGHGLRILLGWKMWDGTVTGEPSQFVARITLWKEGV